MLSLELIAVMGIAYAALVYGVFRTQQSKSQVRSQAESEKSIWTRAHRSR